MINVVSIFEGNIIDDRVMADGALVVLHLQQSIEFLDRHIELSKIPPFSHAQFAPCSLD
jgi:hypothetical protein